MTYKIYFADSGVPSTGLSPVWSSLKNVSDGTDYTPQPVITEIGGGFYKFALVPVGDLVGVIDGGATLGNADRYISALLTPDDANLDEKISDVIVEVNANETKIDAILNVGTGDTTVNHDTGGVDYLRYIADGGIGIDNAIIQAFLKADYDAGNRSSLYVKGKALTDVNGRWVNDMKLDSGNTYTIQFYLQGLYGPDIKEVTI